jgi:hypothetical protein
MKSYDEFKRIKTRQITDDHLKLVKFLISSNTAFYQLENRSFLDCFKMKIPNVQTLTNTILPEIMNKLHLVINEKLVDAENVCLITDIWTNKQMFDFIGIAACKINVFFEREFFIIGMMLMPGDHCAEHIQEALQDAINKYDFDFSKIIGKLNEYEISNRFNNIKIY